MRFPDENKKQKKNINIEECKRIQCNDVIAIISSSMIYSYITVFVTVME